MWIFADRCTGEFPSPDYGRHDVQYDHDDHATRHEKCDRH